MAVKVKVVRQTHVRLPDTLEGPRSVKVGLIKGVADQDNINKGIWNEFGTKGGGWGGPIPERPFLRNTLRNHSAKYTDAMQAAAKSLIKGKTDLNQVMHKLGQVVEIDIKQEINSLKSPPNSPVTIALKGSDNPLIDTGEMRNAVRYKVEK